MTTTNKTGSKTRSRPTPDDRSVRRPPGATAPATKVTPVDRKIGEGPGNLRDRADAFKRRRGGKP